MFYLGLIIINLCLIKCNNYVLCLYAIGGYVLVNKIVMMYLCLLVESCLNYEMPLHVWFVFGMMGLSPSFFVVVAELLACVWNINIHSKLVVCWETCNLCVYEYCYYGKSLNEFLILCKCNDLIKLNGVVLCIIKNLWYCADMNEWIEGGIEVLVLCVYGPI